MNKVITELFVPWPEDYTGFIEWVNIATDYANGWIISYPNQRAGKETHLVLQLYDNFPHNIEEFKTLLALRWGLHDPKIWRT